MKKQSDFGKGMCYCLGLFLAHAERPRSPFQSQMIWFSGAADHLYELEIPKSPKILKERVSKFRNKCLHYRLTWDKDIPEGTVQWAIEEAKELLRLIDEQNKVKTIKADYT